MNQRSLWFRIEFTLLPIVISLVISALLVMVVGRDPLEVLEKIWEGAFRNSRSFAGVLNFWIPLTLVSMGLVVTFRAGLWNIGIEGQMMAGAIFASWAAQFLPIPDNLWMLLIAVEILLAILGGMVWAFLAGFLRIRLGVNEIFGGVALNALANVWSIYLISGPWQPEIGGSAQATEPFRKAALYPPISGEFPASLLMIILALLAAVAVTLALAGTRWGLNLKATGKNARSALLLGVPTNQVAMSAFLVCGALAGLAGSYRVLFTYESLRPLSSGGIGFLGLLVVLLVSIRALWVPFVAFIFAAILSGSTRLRVSLQLDSSLASVLQGTLVLTVLLFSGLRQRFESNQPETTGDDISNARDPITGEAAGS